MNRPLNSKQVEITAVADPIDRMLDAHLVGSGDELTPSSGFVLSVMETIHAQASEPSPITFPWRRVVPGVVAMVCGLAALIVFAARAVHSSATNEPIAPSHLHFALSLRPAFTPSEAMLGCVLLAACLSIAAVAASFRLTGRSR